MSKVKKPTSKAIVQLSPSKNRESKNSKTSTAKFTKLNAVIEESRMN